MTTKVLTLSEVNSAHGRVYECLVLSIPLYNAEVWTLTADFQRRAGGSGCLRIATNSWSYEMGRLAESTARH